ncbi:phosphoserine transaminase [Spirochaeta africana]|uniref:Phosphoserine aminotransferase n=1 Tax=Spirochaeta africana (strain ATCC 700263 / DSM 8902 / Z-7692) TaxID=889378 RepID=H9UMI3_SPIAZ|nr:phosphoserine transaminase [Spirochaeta africana]AFG38726.1 phosphoserine aminotransferase [Spirochaeta africana DSM 8902]
MRKYNFSAGPSTLPVSVLEALQKDLVEYQGMGLSLIEASHRSPEYDAVHSTTLALVKELLQVPDTHEVLLLQGGATLQFGMIPLNFMGQGGSCDAVMSGSWAKKAIADSAKVGTVNKVFDGKDSSYTTLPDNVTTTAGAAYLHITSNETIEGVQWKNFPDTGDVPLIADASSDIMSRPLPIAKFGMIYAGAQKNLGPAGVTLVIIRKDLLERCPDSLPAYLNYKTHADKDSLYNTPPVFAIWAMGEVLKWIKSNGGLDGVQKLNEQKAQLVYDTIAAHGDFYRCPVDPEVRSTMNVVFRLPTEELEKQFIAAAKDKGMIGLKGHRSVGGCRASLYNAMPLEGAQALADFMTEFAKAHG